jgi:hypothetical protein
LFFPFLIPPFFGVQPEDCIWRAREECFIELVDIIMYFINKSFLGGNFSGQIEYSIYTYF